MSVVADVASCSDSSNSSSSISSSSVVFVVVRCCKHTHTALPLFKAIISSFQGMFYSLLSHSLARATVHKHNNKLIT